MNAFKKAHSIAKKERSNFDSYQEAFKIALQKVTSEAHQYAKENRDKYGSYRAAYIDSIYAERHEGKEAFYSRIIRVYGESANKVTVKFRKVSTGEIRTLIGLFGVQEWYSPEGEYNFVKGNGKTSFMVKPIFELLGEKVGGVPIGQYRCFRFDSVIWIKIDGRKFKYTIWKRIKSIF